MKIAYAVLAATAIGLAGTMTLAQGTDHKLITPQEVKWTKGPPSLAPGAEVAGDVARRA